MGRGHGSPEEALNPAWAGKAQDPSTMSLSLLPGEVASGVGGGGDPTFSESSPVSWSWQRCVKTMVKTAWERLLVSFMLVAATVLRGKESSHWILPLTFPTLAPLPSAPSACLTVLYFHSP